MDKIICRVKGLHCAEEILIIKKALIGEPGIHDLEFNILQEKLIVFHDAQKISGEQIFLKISRTGMKPSVWQEREMNAPTEPFWVRYGPLFLTVLSFCFLFAASFWQFFFHLQGSDFFVPTSNKPAPPWPIQFLFVLSIICSIGFTVPKIFASLRRFSFDMNVLMLIAIVGAILINEWFEAASVAFLFSFALLLEKLSVEKARRAVSTLFELAPKEAMILDNETAHFSLKKIGEVDIGSVMLVRPGEKIPLDGIVIKGSSQVDQSTITGESFPVNKVTGDEVFAGTFNHEGALECRITKKSEDTLLSKIIQLVEEARSKRSESEAWVETFAKYYTPLMIVFSAAVMVIPPLFFDNAWFDWIYRGLVMLVIACPCALVISTPVSIVSGLTAAARNGVLIKGGFFLEEVGRLRALALDKTGTLTVGRPEVQRIIPLNQHTEIELMERAYALERPSEHPLAKAIITKAHEMKIQTEIATNYQSVKGKGGLATYKGKLYWIGSHRFMHEMGQETEEIHQLALQLEDAGHSVVALGTDDHVCGLISIADSPKQNINETLKEVKEEGIEHVVMLTGDNEPTAKSLAELAGVDFYKSELLPEEKLEEVTRLLETWEKVGMVGDGVNDAPAMAAATVGFAMAGMGTDVAIETADIALMTDDLAKLPWLMRYSKRVLGIIKQNITFALSIKAAFITLALWDLATLWMAIAADTGATLLVIFNALRLLKNKKKIKPRQ